MFGLQQQSGRFLMRGTTAAPRLILPGRPLAKASPLQMSSVQLTYTPQRQIYSMLYNLLAKNSEVKKHGYKAFDYEDDLR